MSAAPLSAAVQRSPALHAFESLWRAHGVAVPGDTLALGRETAMQRLLVLGLPTSRDETWRYTNLRHLASQAFVAAAGVARASAPQTSTLLPSTANVPTIVIINGQSPSWTMNIPSIDGLEIMTLDELSRSEPETLARLAMPITDGDEARWALVNAALFTTGVYIRISAKLALPVVILQVTAADVPYGIANPRLIVEATAHGEATIIEHFVGQSAHPPLCNAVTEVSLGRAARLDHYRVFDGSTNSEHIHSMAVHQEADSQCRQFTVAVGGEFVRTTLSANLSAPGAQVDSYSLLVGHESRHVDCVNIVTHAAPHTSSKQTARAIASGTSRAVFNTKVIVCAGATHADSLQSCHGLLLSPTAEIDMRPQLEIHADEVKCAHGATIGRLDPDMLFYLLSRGLDRDTAQSLLVFAFLADVLTGMAVPSARFAIEDALLTQLPDSEKLVEFR